jgi:transketolase
MKQKVIYVMTHDSIGLGEDGPTHQPVEQLSSLRSIPNLNIFRPADTIETFECWELALKSKNAPSVLALTRQKVEPVRKEYTNENKCSFGAYEISRTNSKVNLTILASGSEVSLAINVGHKLATQNIYSKVISVPSQELFEKQLKSYKEEILNETKFKVSIEAGSTEGWKKFVGDSGFSFGINNFGKSAPYKDAFKYFGLTSEEIMKKIKEIINN